MGDVIFYECERVTNGHGGEEERRIQIICIRGVTLQKNPYIMSLVEHITCEEVIRRKKGKRKSFLNAQETSRAFWTQGWIYDYFMEGASVE